jgi:hypothetical protein
MLKPIVLATRRYVSARHFRGLHVAFTGTGPVSRAILIRSLRKLGADGHKKGAVTSITTVLVRGISGAWKEPDFGRKERRMAERLRGGQDSIVVSADDYWFRILAGKSAVVRPAIAGERVRDLLSANPASALKWPVSLDHFVSKKERVEQQKLRRLLFGVTSEAKCSLCARRLGVSFLTAAHIKPREYCTPAERRDLGNVAMPLCELGCHTLYDAGLVTVGDGGAIRISPLMSRNRVFTSFVRSLKGRVCGAYQKANAGYYEWHEANAFSS